MAEEHMKGKTVLITGGTDGIGKQAAKEIAAIGAKVVLVGRSRERSEQAVAEVIASSHNADVDYLMADLSSMGEVKALAGSFRAKFDRLDVLVNNAGAGFVCRNWTVDGYEKTFALNHLAYFLLTHLLLDMLQASAPSRVVSTSSGSSYSGRIHFEDIHLKRFYFVHTAYAQSKLANVMFTYALARRLEGSGVTANVFHPGLVKTGIFRKVPKVGWLADKLILDLRKPISVEEGAQTLVYLATSPKVAGQSGHFYYKKKIRQTIPQSYSVEDQERLWELSMRMVKDWW
jgi:NAD(P)-dependent dehydrogenase (short-subunit alcohol dehydrogenase family)